MAERIAINGPDFPEEARQLAEAVVDLHYTMSILVENAAYFVPGETADELTDAWRESEISMRELVEDLIHLSQTGKSKSADRPITQVQLEQSELTGPVGTLKRSSLRLLKERFLRWWNAQPHTDERIQKASSAASDYLELGSTFVSSIGMYEQVAEILSLGRQLLSLRAKRGV